MKRFFIVALGRSGIAFLAHLLNLDPRARVVHEPCPGDRQLLFYRYAGCFAELLEQLLDQRFNRVLSETSELEGVEVYGEVNGYLRYEVDWLRARGWACFFLVRDGRNFVRSAYSRPAYTPQDIQQPIAPKDGDPLAASWADMDRFARLCWLWHHTNDYLLSKFNEAIRLEDIISDYSCFQEQLLRPLDLNIPELTWRREVNKPRNTGQDHLFRARLKYLLSGGASRPRVAKLPRPNEWSRGMKTVFNDICAGTMARLGYQSFDQF